MSTNKSTSTKVLSLLAILVWMASFSSEIQAQIRIVSPSDFAEEEGNSSLAENCCAGFRFRLQHAFLAEDFMSLPDGGAWLTSLALRPDSVDVTGPQSKLLSETMMAFSTTDSGVNSNLSLTFSENRGSDSTIVKTGDFHLTTENLGPVGGPKLFDYVVEFDEPFFYNPDEGNLLWEWAGRSEASLFMDSDDRRRQIVFGGANDTRGDYFGAFVVEFNFVPEPSARGLSMVAAIAFMGCMKRRRTGCHS